MLNNKRITLSLISIPLLCGLLFMTCFQGESKAKEIPVKPEMIHLSASEFLEGDVIFQSSNSGQSRAIQLATKSQWSHCGILFKYDQQWYVSEAVQPVKKTLLSDWIKRGDEGFYSIKRLVNRDEILTDSVIQVMKLQFERWQGKNYDLYFNWSDEEMYCSEFVYKIYFNATGLSLGDTHPMKSYDLSHPEVKRIMEQRYGKNVPLQEPMIAPVDLYNSSVLISIP